MKTRPSPFTPLTFDEAVAKLARTKRKDSQAEESDSTTEPARRAAGTVTFPLHPLRGADL